MRLGSSMWIMRLSCDEGNITDSISAAHGESAISVYWPERDFSLIEFGQQRGDALTKRESSG